MAKAIRLDRRAANGPDSVRIWTRVLAGAAGALVLCGICLTLLDSTGVLAVPVEDLFIPSRKAADDPTRRAWTDKALGPAADRQGPRGLASRSGPDRLAPGGLDPDILDPATGPRFGRPVRMGTPSNPILGASPVETALAQLGQVYVYGGERPDSGFDCSGLVQWSFARHGVGLPRTAREQAAVGLTVEREALKPGDLVFFSQGSGVDHVGVHLAQGRFVHSSRGRGEVTVDNLDAPFWNRLYAGARRIL